MMTTETEPKTTKPKRTRKLDSLKRTPPPIPVHDNPKQELRRLVSQHSNATRKMKAMAQMVTDRKCLADRKNDAGVVFMKKGDTIKADVSEEARFAIVGKGGVVDTMKADCKRLERLMEIELKKMPVYVHFLQNVYGAGPVVCAYLCALIDVHVAQKPSQLHRFCGVAPSKNTGRLERPTKGQKLGYCAELRTRLWQMMTAAFKNASPNKAARWVEHDELPDDIDPKQLDQRENKATGRHEYRLKSATAPNGFTSKYLEAWFDLVARKRSMGQPGGFKSGLWRGAGIFLTDLYVVWRTLEERAVWPGYHAMRMGYEHGPDGKLVVNEPRILTLEAALEMVGNVGGYPLAEPRTWAGKDEPIDESEVEA